MKRTKRTTLEPRPVVEPGTEPHRGRCSVCGYAIGKGGCWFNPAHTNTNTNAKREVENGDMRAVLTDGGPGGRAEVRGLRGALRSIADTTSNPVAAATARIALDKEADA